MPNHISVLKQSDIFHQFTQTQLELVANLCVEKNFTEGETIFEESSTSKELFIIAQGQVEVLINPNIIKKNSAAPRLVIATLRRGQSFGEVALVDEGQRSASVRAAHKDTRLLMIPRDKLIMLCETYPQLGYRLMYNLAADLAMKIRNTDMQIREKLLYGQQK